MDTDRDSARRGEQFRDVDGPCTVEELGHTAEIGFRVRAPDVETLFACAGQALFGLMGVEVDADAPAVERRVTVDSFDRESLLVDWLNELLYLHETTGEVFTQCRVQRWTPTRLEAVVWGRRPLSSPVLDVKAVTYHQLQVTEEAEGWTAQVFLDI